MMKEAKIRTILRWVHIVLGLVIMFYIYSPFHKYPLFQIVIKFVIIPIITLTGFWILKFKAFNKSLRIST